MLALLAACNSSAPKKQPASAASPLEGGSLVPQTHKPAPNPAPTDTPTDLQLTSLTVADFLAKFHYRMRPDDCVIAPDFVKKIDPTLNHFERVEVILADGKRTELRMQSFGAWAIWKNFDGNYEMLTTTIGGGGVLMHLHTLDRRFESLGSIELARRSNIEGDETVKRGSFLEGDNYRYTVVTHRDGARIDSANGHIVILTSGNYKVLDEIR
jgi:hypothetical protein